MHLKNDWKADYSVAPGMRLKEQTAGVIGLGNIGTRFAELAQAIGMEVIYWSRSSRDERFEYCELEEVFRKADVIFPALVENEETQKILSNELIASCKNTAILVGINRVKDLWDEEYIMKRVGEGSLGGYSFEGDNAQHYEKYKGNIWAVPPIAWRTEDALANAGQIWVENILSILKSEPQNVVN